MPDDQGTTPDLLFDTLQAALAQADAALAAAEGNAEIQAAIAVRAAVQDKIDALNEGVIAANDATLENEAAATAHSIDELTALKNQLAQIAAGFAVAAKVIDVLDTALAKLAP